MLMVQIAKDMQIPPITAHTQTRHSEQGVHPVQTVQGAQAMKTAQTSHTTQPVQTEQTVRGTKTAQQAQPATEQHKQNTAGRFSLYLRLVVGYSCTVIWAVAILFSQMFGDASSSFTVPISMLPGLLTCLVSIVCFQRMPAFRGRTPLVLVSALLMCVGTVGVTWPYLGHVVPGVPWRILGLVVSGFTTLFVVMAYFDVWARLRARSIIVLGGISLTLSSVVCWVVLSGSLTQMMAAVVISALPVVAFGCLPGPKHEIFGTRTEQMSGRLESARTKRTLAAVLSVAIPWRTLLGFAITFFVVGSIGALAPSVGDFGVAVGPGTLVYPLVMTLFFVGSAYFVRGQLDPAILYKMILAVFAGLAFLLAFSVGANTSIVFYAVITAEVMMWIVLALWAGKTPVAHYLVFAIGWMSECAGNIAGHFCALALRDDLMMYFALTLVLILVAIGFAFSEGKFLLDVDFDDAPHATKLFQSLGIDEAKSAVSQPSSNSLGAASEPHVIKETAAPTLKTYIDAFVVRYDLSPREADVFAEWVTGHGLKYIQEALFISESTVKTHLRNIYRKCDTHSRDELIALFERETNARN